MKTLIENRIGEWALDEGPPEWASDEGSEVPSQFAKVEKCNGKEVRRKPGTPGWMRLRMGARRGKGFVRESGRLLPGWARFVQRGILEAPSAPDARGGRRTILSAGAALALLLGALPGCASTPLAAFPATHPASPEAPETVINRQRNDLSVDQPTRTTRDLLTKTQAQSSAAQHGPAANH
jgi:hypothetical protein